MNLRRALPIWLGILSIAYLSLFARPAECGVQWRTNDDQIYGTRGATVLLLAERASNTATIGIRVEESGDEWVIIVPDELVFGEMLEEGSTAVEVAKLVVRFDDELPLEYLVVDPESENAWRFLHLEDEQDFLSRCSQSDLLRWRLESLTRRYTTQEVYLTLFQTAMYRANLHVEPPSRAP